MRSVEALTSSYREDPSRMCLILLKNVKFSNVRDKGHTNVDTDGDIFPVKHTHLHSKVHSYTYTGSVDHPFILSTSPDHHVNGIRVIGDHAKSRALLLCCSIQVRNCFDAS
jgi:hypothetical protein